MKELRVLGIDLASARWSNNGSAVLRFDASTPAWTAIRVPAIVWPTDALTPVAMAKAIDRFAVSHDIIAVALDGPQGWRDPDTAAGLPGVGRRCERACGTQGRTGVQGKSYPQKQCGWITFCIDVFAELLSLGHAQLGNAAGSLSQNPNGYWIVECFPTWTWRESGLEALPGKAGLRNHGTGPYWEALQEAFDLPNYSDAIGHDDLQGIVAALAASAAVGGPCISTAYGEPSRIAAGANNRAIRLEGLIWSARPSTALARGKNVLKPNLPVAKGRIATTKSLRVRVTQNVINQVKRQGKSAEQIAITGTAIAEVDGRQSVRICGADYLLIKKDTHAIWRSHQTPATISSFETLFRMLSDKPDEWVNVDAEN